MPTEEARQRTPGPAEDDSPAAKIAELSRSANSKLEHALVDALRAVIWKLGGNYSGGSRSDSRDAAYATAVEVERRVKSFGTPATINIHTGNVDPVDGLEEELTEVPLVQSGDVKIPDWATSSADHAWVEVDPVGTPEKFLVDPFSPPQFTGSPFNTPKVLAIGEGSYRPVQYVPDSRTPERLSDASITESFETPWPAATHSWPHGAPSTIEPVPSDGGSDILATANTVVEIDAQQGLKRLPTDSVDVIVTSPPYRLQRAYPDAESVWDGDPHCDHEWVNQPLWTETTVRKNGGAGMNSEGTQEETANDRNRDSLHCEKCGAWKGQLGHEPELDLFISHLTSIFEQCRRILKPQGSLYVNVGDSYDSKQKKVTESGNNTWYRDAPEKSLIAFPAKLMVQMIEDGWIAREHYAWCKNNPAPNGRATDRPTKAWEDVFRFVQQADYHDTGEGPKHNVLNLDTASRESNCSAPMPKSLPDALLKAAAPRDEETVVLDPFCGSGTVLESAADLGYNYIGFEINGETASEARDRLANYDRAAKPITGQETITSYT